MEEVKRLTPIPEVLRELYLKSGNRCAYPECNHLIINEEGVFVAQMCHIEAAMPGGPRFNPSQTNEERRAFDNLILLCHAHHKTTDDESKYSVDRLREIKKIHELKFSHIINDITDSIIDKTTMDDIQHVINLKKMNRVCKWDLNNAQLIESVAEFNIFESRIQNITRETRQILCIIAKKAVPQNNEIPVHELEKIINISKSLLWEHLQLLDKYNLACEGRIDDYGQPQIELKELPSGWPIFSDLVTFAQETGVRLEELIVDFKFSHFDE